MIIEDTLADADKQILVQSLVFKGLPPNEITPIIDASQVRIYGNGQTILSSGNVGDGLYVILEGKAEVYLPGPSVNHDAFSKHAMKESLATLECGACFGEYSLVDQKEVSATVDALTRTRLCHLSTQNFNKIISTNLLVANIIYKNLLLLLVSRCREANSELDGELLSGGFLIY